MMMTPNPLNPLDLLTPPQGMSDLTPEEQEQVAVTTALCGCCTWVAALVLGLVLCVLFGSCTTTRTVTVERVSHDTVQIASQQRDSIFLRDSIFVREHQQGDTVLMEVSRWHTQYRDRWLHDSIYIARRDTIPVPVPVDRPVPMPLTQWQLVRLWLANAVLIALALCAAVWLLRRYIRSRLKMPM